VGIEKISATLGVHYVLQGSVRKAERQLRISAQLLDERGRQLWAQTFDRELTNVFEIQEEIAQAVVARIATEVSSRPRTPSQPALDAYDRYLTGRELLHRRDVTGAMTELKHAIDLDPRFAEAQAEWAIARLIGTPSQQELDAAAAAIDRALELKPQLLRAQAARGLWFLQSTPPDPAAAKSVLQGVLEQDPNMSDALLWLSIALDQSGQPEEAAENLKRAARIDPLHPSIMGNLAAAFIEKGDDEAALDLLTRQLQQPNPGYGIYVTLRDFYRTRGRLVDLNAIGKDVSLRGVDTHYALAVSYALLGDFEAADAWMARSHEDFPTWPMWPYAVSVAANWRGDIEQSRLRFEQGVASAGLRIEELSPVFRIWYGALLARSGHHAAAIKVLEPLAPTIRTTGQFADDELPDTDGLHALAWSYLHTGEKARAEKILSDLLDHCRSDLDDRQHPANSKMLHRCAETALLAGDAEQALALLERATKAGWRDYYVRRNDPYWAALESDPRYRALMATVKADIDRQRAEVERIDATDGFRAKLDAAMAARRGSEK
jgi:tetratricopeptide (TPR) repeat protein